MSETKNVSAKAAAPKAAKPTARKDMTKAQWIWKEMKRTYVAYIMCAPFFAIFFTLGFSLDQNLFQALAFLASEYQQPANAAWNLSSAGIKNSRLSSSRFLSNSLSISPI